MEYKPKVITGKVTGTGWPIDGHVPVSYKHLDVYQRQVQGRESNRGHGEPLEYDV